MITETRRKEIIDCLHNWKISYQITGNQNVINKCITELVGENQLIWFNYSQYDDFENNEDCKKIEFDAKKVLIEFLNLRNASNTSQNDSWDTIRNRVFKAFERSFPNRLCEIIGQANPTLKRNELIEFIKSCENCYRVTQSDTFVKLSKDAKKVDLQLNDCIQAKAFSEISDLDCNDIKDISDNFIRLIADPKTIVIKPPLPIEYIIQQQDEGNIHWLKSWYSKYGWQTHIVILIIIGSIFYRKFYDYESFWLIELLLAIALTNLLIGIYFKFFYQERIQNKNL